jgi:hypothetical protein
LYVVGACLPSFWLKELSLEERQTANNNKRKNLEALNAEGWGVSLALST